MRKFIKIISLLLCFCMVSAFGFGCSPKGSGGTKEHHDLKEVVNEFKALHLRHPPASVVHISDADGTKEPSRKPQEETPAAPL